MSVKISRILHAGYVLQSIPDSPNASSTQILFDPIFENPFSQNCYAFPNVQFDLAEISNLKPNAIFISHYHDDHCSFDSLQLLNRDIPIYMFCIFEEMFIMLHELGFKNVFSIELDQKICIGDFEITAQKALDADTDSIFHVQYKNLNILNVVDSWIDEDTLEMLAKKCTWHMVLWPFQTMRELEVISPKNAKPSDCLIPNEWILQLTQLNPQFVVPSSCQFIQEDWSWYQQHYFPISYAGFQKQIEAALPKVKIIRMNPGVSVLLSDNSVKFCDNVPFVQAVGSQDVDYVYQPLAQIQSSSEIAKKMKSLNQTEKNMVMYFCKKQIIEKYNAIEPSDEAYFNEKQIWKLIVYDNLGLSADYLYEIKNKKIIGENNFCQKFTWLTEISEAKLFSALAFGESLTTLYLRINDFDYLQEVNNRIKDVDISEDPLIKSLYTGIFGAYQRMQLLRIKNKL